MKPVHDIWHGDSRILCERFKVGSVSSVITDPPYGVDNQSNSSVTKEGKAHATKIANDESPEIAIKVFNEVMDVLLPRTASNSDLYVFTSYQVLEEWLGVARKLDRHGFKRKAVLVWEKSGPGMGDLNSWGQGHEFCIYLKKGNRVLSDKRRSGVIHIQQLPPSKLIHPHEKNTALLELLLKASTDKGDFVVDPFGGSGSLVRAARNIGRNAVSIELDEERYKSALDKLNTQEQGFNFDE